MSDCRKIQILVGMIASGKSTYAKNAAKHGYLVMCDDAVVTMLYGGDYTLYKKDDKIIHKSIENCIVSCCLLANKKIIIDRGLNISKKSRKRWIVLANSFDVSVDVVVFNNEGPEIHAERRFKSDHRGYNLNYWFEVANKHYNSWDDPSKDEGIGMINKISWDELTAGKVF